MYIHGEPPRERNTAHAPGRRPQPPPPRLSFACSPAAPIPLYPGGRPVRGRGLLAQCGALASDKEILLSSLLVIVVVEIDTLRRSPR